MIALFQRLKPQEILIEDIAQFMPRKSMANTIILLAVFNRMISLCAYEYLGKEPKHFPVMTIRNGIRLSPYTPEKHEIPALVEKHLKIKIPLVKKKTGKPIDEYYDQADAIAVGLYYALLLNNNLCKIPRQIVKKEILSKAPAKRKAKRKKK